MIPRRQRVVRVAVLSLPGLAAFLGPVPDQVMVLLALPLADAVLSWRTTSTIERLAAQGIEQGVEIHLRSTDLDVHVGGPA